MLEVEEGFSAAVIAGYLGDISCLSTNKKTKSSAVVGAAYGNKQGLVKSLIAQGANKDHAVQGNHKALVDSLIDKGASKDRAVAAAAYANNQKLAGWLIIKGASIECAAAGKRARPRGMVDLKARRASSQLSRSPHVLNAKRKLDRQGESDGDKPSKKPGRKPKMNHKDVGEISFTMR